jgi:hypothetical protein
MILIHVLLRTRLTEMMSAWNFDILIESDVHSWELVRQILQNIANFELIYLYCINN